MDVLHQHPIRKNKKQKQAFLSDVIPFAENLGYSVKVEKGKMGCHGCSKGHGRRNWQGGQNRQIQVNY
jgi:hypothetical protein